MACTSAENALLLLCSVESRLAAATQKRYDALGPARHATTRELTASPCAQPPSPRDGCTTTARPAYMIPGQSASDWLGRAKRFKPAPGSSPTRPVGRIVASNTIKTRSPTAIWSCFPLNTLAGCRTAWDLQREGLENNTRCLTHTCVSRARRPRCAMDVVNVRDACGRCFLRLAIDALVVETKQKRTFLR